MVQIGPGREGELAVRVVSSPAGEGGALFRLPWTGAEWLPLRAGLRRAARHLVTDEAPPASLPPREVGEALFSALFAGQVGALFAHSLGIVGHRGLRLRLRFQLDPEDPGLGLLHSLPWELLFQPDTRDFLGLSRLTPIVRSLEIPRPSPPLPLPSPLRILVVPASPSSLTPLDLEREESQIKEAWSGLPDVEVVCLDRAGPAALRQKLLAGPFHVLHFMGHGELDPATGEGLLFLEGADGARVPLSGEALATVLKDFRTLRLVFLNACETGRTPDGADRDPFAGVATALVLGGVPAVIAMQLPIADDAAITFSRTVYDRLAAGDPVDAAVAEGRQALYAASRDTVDWAIPVLFTRIPDGRIFAPGLAVAPAPPPPEPKVRPVPRRKRHLFAGTAALVFLALLAVFAVRNIGAPVPLAGGRYIIETAQVGTFRIARTEVTHRDYLRFVQDMPEWRKDQIRPELQDDDYLRGWISPTEYPAGMDDHPVIHVSWFAAKAFCEWTGGSLPTKEQWKIAAHSAEHRFPWGPLSPSEPPPLNFCDLECDRQHRDGTYRKNFRDNFAETAPVKSFPGGRTPEGVFDLSGNVWEWTLNASGDERVTMGGSYLMTYEECSTDKNGLEEARLCAPDVGFRCVWD